MLPRKGGRPNRLQLLGWVEDDKIQPLAVRTYPFEQVAQAHRDLESGQTVGKLVLIT